MKKLMVILAIALFPNVCMAGSWAIVTKDNEVSSADQVRAEYTESVVTQSITRGGLVAEAAAKTAEIAVLQARIAECQTRINYINNTALPWIDTRLPKLLPPEEPQK